MHTYSAICAGMQTAAESDLASELPWRIAALEALHAFVVGPLSQATPVQSAALTASCASLLQPTLDAITTSPALQVSTVNTEFHQHADVVPLIAGVSITASLVSAVYNTYAGWLPMLGPTGVSLAQQTPQESCALPHVACQGPLRFVTTASA